MCMACLLPGDVQVVTCLALWLLSSLLELGQVGLGRLTSAATAAAAAATAKEECL